MISTPQSYARRDYGEEIRHVSSTDFYRFIRFVHSREHAGRSVIWDPHRRSPSSHIGKCGGCDKDWSDAGGFRYHLGRIAEERFIQNPCVEFKETFMPAYDMLQGSRHDWE